MATASEVMKAALEGKGPLGKSHPDEPVFILCARDPEAAALVELWALRARQMGVNNDKVQQAMNDAEEFLRWPHRKQPD